MIISASRRTDIPAFHSQWFLNRLKEEYVLVRNPMNHNQVSKISLSKEDVECIVFWTKNPYPLMQHLDCLTSYNYYFQFTLTSYGQSIEKNLPMKSKLVPVFKSLASQIGPSKVIWRYDPIFTSPEIGLDDHLENFKKLAFALRHSTDKCVFSFLDMYKKIQARTRASQIQQVPREQMEAFAGNLAYICKENDIQLATCSENIDLSHLGISKNKCIDDDLIKKLFNYSGNVERHVGQRKACGCVTSIDIGAYNTCHHACLYCYANINKVPQEKYDKQVILGKKLSGKEQIYEKKPYKVFSSSFSLIDLL